ncbi:MAG: glycoside hydrolase family 3 C-terminal domain-containing protein [Tannerella sp.]|jgi:beta-glucosidase|nr:glycoside hydrolase family 3 C-terminal domain-containing protein [Tannerella sp.]
MKKVTIPLLGLLLALTACHQKPAYKYAFQNPNLPVDERVNDVVGRLSIEEKISQMMNNAPAIPRLGIPAYNWWSEALHGVARSSYRTTSYPQAIGMAASWDAAGFRIVGDQISTEGRAVYHDALLKHHGNSIYRGLTYWSPNINIFRDPRWGRGQETYGEDPFLTATLGTQFVEGIQGTDTFYLKASACAKHYGVHSGPEWSRHTYNAVVSNHDLWDTYLPAFQHLVLDAHVSGVMCAYNAIYGQPCCGSDLLMNDILRNQWKFSGYVTSDCGAIDDFYRTHKTSPNAATASADAVEHSTDCECGSSYKALVDAIGTGLITEKQLDVSLKRLFKIRFRLGQFDPQDRVPFANTPLDSLETPAHKAQALKMAQESMVLLRNEGNVLPIDFSKVKKIALVGPHGDDRDVMLANYHGTPSHVISLLEGLRAKVGNRAQITYERGVNLTDNCVFNSHYDASLFTTGGKPGFKADYFQNMKLEGPVAASRVESRIDHHWGDSETVIDSVIARRLGVRFTTLFTPKESGDVCFALRGNRSEFYIDGVLQKSAAPSDAYYPLKAEKGKSYKLEIRYRQYGENGEIVFDYGTLTKADPAATAARVKDADLIIYAGGISSRLEGEEMNVQIKGFKGGDRTDIALPAVQEEMLRALKATGKPVVFVLMSGSAIGLEWESKNIPAILEAWYGGEAGGEAIADVLTGDYNPAGRLPVTFYRSVADLPDFEDYSMDNRTYRYFKGTPVYPFGYGLSYTTFKYSNLSAEKTADGKLQVKVTLTNTGKRAGDEVVELYLSNKRDFLTPIRALKGFRRLHLAAGQSLPVSFTLEPAALTVVDKGGHSIPMQGDVVLSLGGGQPSATNLAAGGCLEKTLKF